MRHLLAALFVLLGLGCSILDPGDRQELRDRIAALPEAEAMMATQMAMNKLADNWLSEHNKTDHVGKLQCRVQAGGKWTEWDDYESHSVGEMLKCLRESQPYPTYLMCQLEWEFVWKQHWDTELKNSHPVPGGATIECRYVWDSYYKPENVPKKLVDPNAVEPDDIIDAMIASPVPPLGFPFPSLVPVLCPLGAGPGWGCPPDPTDPSDGQPTTPSGDPSGDKP